MMTGALAATVAVFVGSQIIGTGALVPEGILSVWHVCARIEPIGYAYVGDGRPTAKVVVERSDPSTDLCLLKRAAEDELTPVALRDPSSDKVFILASELMPSSWVKTAGYPFGNLKVSEGEYKGVDQWNLSFFVWPGMRCPPPLKASYKLFSLLGSCTGRYVVGDTTLYTDRGASGSPVINTQGKLVGLVQNMSHDRQAGIVVLDQIREFLESGEGY